MDCNKDEAVRAKEIAERKFSEREYAGAKKFALKAQNLYPALEGLTQLLATLDVYISAENKVSGEMDWYGILGVDPFADEETIKKQYKKLALALHPDKNKSLGGEGAFQLVKEAWGLLSDKAKRLVYNQKRSLKGLQHKTPNHVGSQSEAPSANGLYKVTKNVTSNVRSGSNNVHMGPTSVPPPHKKAETFWTVCNRCRTHYEYLRIYLNHTLLCPNCHEAFLAVDRGPPPNVSKSSNWPSHQQHQNCQHYAPSSNNTINPGSNTSFQWGPHSRMAGSSSVVAPGASVELQVGEKVRRERDRAPSIAEWERSQMSHGNDGSFHKVEKPSKKRRADDTHINGYHQYMTNHMTMGHGSAGVGSASELRMAGSETERWYGKPYSIRELSMLEIRNMLMNKARIEIHKKLKEWRSVIKTKVTNKDENKRQKSILNDKGRQDGTSFSATSDETNKQKLAYATITVPDSDFHNFDTDRTESSFNEDQVWAAYDDDDGMPRYYARIHKVISLNPFRMRISWLNSRSNSELAPIDWIGSGFYKTCGDFRTGRHEITDSLNSFSHKVRWIKGNRGVIRIFPGKGEVWALYRNWSPDWNQNTPDEVIHKYDMVEVLEDFSEEQGVLVAPLIKAAGFRVVFHRHLDPDQLRRIPKEEMFRFSHQVPYHLLTGGEAHNSPKGCRELDPAATPSDLIGLTEEASDEKP